MPGSVGAGQARDLQAVIRDSVALATRSYVTSQQLKKGLPSAGTISGSSRHWSTALDLSITAAESSERGNFVCDDDGSDAPMFRLAGRLARQMITSFPAVRL